MRFGFQNLPWVTRKIDKVSRSFIKFFIMYLLYLYSILTRRVRGSYELAALEERQKNLMD